jgi:hypothetical protein
MSIVMPALAVAFAAFCVWLGVRIFNRRERWAKRTAVLVVGLPLFYILSIGPVCWLVSRVGVAGSRGLGFFYRPLLKACVISPRPVAQLLYWYSCIGAADHWAWHQTIDTDEFDWSGHTHFWPGKPRFQIPWSAR